LILARFFAKNILRDSDMSVFGELGPHLVHSVKSLFKQQDGRFWSVSPSLETSSVAILDEMFQKALVQPERLCASRWSRPGCFSGTMSYWQQCHPAWRTTRGRWTFYL